MSHDTFIFYVYLGAFLCTLMSLTILMVLAESRGYASIREENNIKKATKRMSMMKEMT